MTLRFRQTFTLFPGVRINVGKRGISTSIGVPGATINIGQKGVRATIGLPGTGLSYSTQLTPNRSEPAPATLDDSPQDYFQGNIPKNAPVYVPQAGMKEISSASVEVLTSTSLAPLRDMIANAREQKKQVEADLSEAQSEHSKQEAELATRKRSIFRYFYKRRIAELTEQIPKTKLEIDRLIEWNENTKISIAFETTDTAQRAYASLVRAFESLRHCSKKWDVTSDRGINQFAERSTAVRVVDRHPVIFDFSRTDLIQFSGQAMRFQNVNGDDILIYPGVAVMPRPDGLFALIDIRELDVQGNATGFQETESVPSDSKVIGQTWAKTNKDGSPDRRFKDNYQIPVCEYGRITFRSKSGVAEEYQVSNADAAISFSRAVAAYKSALSS
ncbi:MAG: DUF4236 domain-containing protein [Acidimicrobiales bacterium]